MDKTRNKYFGDSMKKITLLAVLLSISLLSWGKDIRLKEDWNVKADGKTKITAKLQKAINEVSLSGGGKVILSGGVFLSGPIEIKSDVNLVIDFDATLLASPDIEDYPDRTDARHYITENLPRWRNAAFIFADEAENIAITGLGTIDCNGTYHVQEKADPDWVDWQFERKYPIEVSLPRVVFFAGCKKVSVTDVSLVNQPAGWGYWIHDCDQVIFDRCRIHSDVRYRNNDGIHINSSRDVTVSNCLIESGDDAIVVRANNRSLRENKVCERVVITNCTLRSWACGIRIGWVNDGIIRHCIFSNIVINDSGNGVGMWFPAIPNKNDYGREASLVEDLCFTHIIMDGIYSHPVLSWVSPDPGTKFEGIRNIRFYDVYCRGLQFPYMVAPKEHPYEDIQFTNCTFMKVSDDVLPDYVHHGGAVIDRKMEDKMENIKGLVYNNTKFITE